MHGIGQRSQLQSIAISSSDSGSRLNPAAANTPSIPDGMRPASRSATNRACEARSSSTRAHSAAPNARNAIRARNDTVSSGPRT